MWIWWVLATLTGFAVAGPVGHAVGHALGAASFWSVFTSVLMGGTGRGGAPHGGAIFGIGFGAVFGILSSIPQWFVLRRWAVRSAWWVPATAAGWTAAFAVDRALVWGVGGFPMGWVESGLAGGAQDGLLAGILVGIAQAIALGRQPIRPVWWIVLTTLGVAAGWITAWAVGDTVVPSLGSAAGAPIGLAAGGAVTGASTGIVLVRSRVASG